MATIVSLEVKVSPGERSPAGWNNYWQKQLAAASKRLRKYRNQGVKVVDRFLDDRGNSDDMRTTDAVFSINLFNTNISTMQSMLYGSTPKIDVSREHQDPNDDVARVASVLFKRILETDISDPANDVPTAIRAALQDRLLPGMGICRVRYDVQSSMGEDEMEIFEGESAPIDYVHWQDFAWGWSRTWAELPWISFRSWLTKEEATERFGDKAEHLSYKNQLPSGTDENVGVDEEKDNVQKAAIWEFWNKEDRRVYWYSEGLDNILDVQDDPLGLADFWPTPMPMTANLTTTLYQPKADYILAQDLYSQVDILQTRISIITRAVKVVGVYDKSASDSVGRMLKEGLENDLIPVDNYAMFAEKGGLRGTIDWYPVETVVNTLSTLRSLLGETIELLYQVTGMSDVLRGANTDQYTSDGTNQLKAKFGSIRVQALQDEFARFASDLEGLKAEVIAKHFSPESILTQSSAQYMPMADMENVLPAIQLMKSPDLKWRINIKPESIALIDYASIKQERTEFLTAMATFMQSASPLMQSVPNSLPILLEFLKYAMAGFKGSDYMEGILDQAIDEALKAPPPEDEGNKAKELEGMRQQAEMAKIQAKSQADMQLAQMKLQGEMQKLAQDSQANVTEIAAKSQADLQKIATDLQADLAVIKAKLNSDVTVETTQAQMNDAEKQAEHQYQMTEDLANHQYNMAEIEENNEVNERTED